MKFVRPALAVLALCAVLGFAFATTTGFEGKCCITNSDCGSSGLLECRNDRCLDKNANDIPGSRPPPPQGTQCTTKDQCGSTEVCAYGFCKPASNPFNNNQLGQYCLRHEDCFSPDLICIDTQCTWGTCPPIQAGSCCTSNSQCTDTTYGPLECRTGNCHNVNANQIPGPNPPSPQGTQCTTKYDCASGSICWFGFCRPDGFSDNSHQGLFCQRQEDCFSADLICVDTQCVVRTCPV